MSIRSLLKSLTPPVVLQLYRKLTSAGIVYEGDYNTWNTVIEKSTGFHETAILEKVRASAKQVKDGKAAYERDSLLFDSIQYSWPVLACLEHVALVCGGLHLIDFGGSLGTSYFQNRLFLKPLPSLKWIVVEQKHYVDCGKREFDDGCLTFDYSIDNVLKTENVNCLLVSGAIQYVEDPVKWFLDFQNYGFEYLLFDRTCFIEGKTRLTLQKVPAQIYHASFPCWFFNEAEFVNHFSGRYELLADFDSADESILSSDHKRMYWKGFFFKRKVVLQAE